MLWEMLFMFFFFKPKNPTNDIKLYIEYNLGEEKFIKHSVIPYATLFIEWVCWWGHDRCFFLLFQIVLNVYWAHIILTIKKQYDK